MSNEPVAWIDPFDLERLPLYDSWVSGEKTKKVDIPLYTHPVKEQDTDCQYCKQGCIRCDARKQLTDEEIYQTWVEAKNTALNTRGSDFVEVIFARAILRKAQEK